MKLKTTVAFLCAAGASTGAAFLAADRMESSSGRAVRSALIDSGYEWAQISTDGLKVELSGTAPDEAKRFSAVSAAGRVIDPDRIVDLMEVRAQASVNPPRFSVEMLRNSSGISLIGLIPSGSDRDAIVSSVEDLSDNESVTDLLESASYPVPQDWDSSISFALQVLADLPRSKVSVEAGVVTVTAISGSPKEKAQIERALLRELPDEVELVMEISAPRPVISPFTLRLTLTEEGAKFDACSAPNERDRSAILEAASKLGISDAECRIGLGVPSPRWPEAISVAIDGLQSLGGGSLTFSDADVTLVATDTTPQGQFDRVVGDLKAQLPEVFSLHAVLPEKVVVDGTGDDDSLIEFVATRSPEGLVQLRGRLIDETTEQIVGSFARAQFGSDAVYLATRNDPELPQDWPIRVLASLEALATLNNGVVVVQPDYVEIRGTSGSKDSTQEISRILADKLGDAQNFDVTIAYDELLDVTLNIPTPQECVDRINLILNASKIVFEPSSAEITEAAGRTVDRIAEIARQCSRVQMEIGGHTDSQGREIMNEALSQQRADAVLAALLSRRVLTRNFTAKGYGETVPIADNKTEEGREQNRRIEFRLLTDARLAAPDEDELAAPPSSETPDGQSDDQTAGGPEAEGEQETTTDENSLPAVDTGAGFEETEGSSEQN